MPLQAQAIPSPVPMTISPGMFAAYGALVAAAVLMILYLYRGRAFVVYWIGSWLLVAASMMLLARGYDDIRLGSVVLGLAQLLGVWSAGLMLLAAILFGWASLRYFRLGRRTRHIGAYVICGGMVLTCATSVAAAGVVFDAQFGAAPFNRLLTFSIVLSMFVALGMQLLVFEDMT